MPLKNVAKDVANIAKAANTKGSKQQRDEAVRNAVRESTGRDVGQQLADRSDPHNQQARQTPKWRQQLRETLGGPNQGHQRTDDSYAELQEAAPSGYTNHEIPGGLPNSLNVGDVPGFNGTDPWKPGETGADNGSFSPEASRQQHIRDRQHESFQLGQEAAINEWLSDPNNQAWVDPYNEYFSNKDPNTPTMSPQSFQAQHPEYGAVGPSNNDFDNIEYWNTRMNDGSPESEAAKRALGITDRDFDYYQDFGALSVANDPATRAIWISALDDPATEASYLELLGSEIDTNGDNQITEDEAADFYDRQAAVDWNEHGWAYDPNDQYSRWYYGDYGYGNGGVNDVTDAYNNYYVRTPIEVALEEGNYADLVANGQIQQVLDENGNDLFDTLDLQGKHDALATALANGEDTGTIQKAYDEALKQWNNAYKAAAMADYYSGGGTGNYLNFGVDDMAAEDAQNISRAYRLATDDFGGAIPAPVQSGIGNILSGSYGVGDLSQYGSAEEAIQAANDRRWQDAQARGYEATMNNVAGGNAGYRLVNEDELNNPIGPDRTFNQHARETYLDTRGDNDIYNDVMYTKPVTGTIRDMSMADLSGSPVIDPDYYYMMMQNTGLADAGYRLYGGATPVIPTGAEQPTEVTPWQSFVATAPELYPGLPNAYANAMGYDPELGGQVMAAAYANDDKPVMQPSYRPGTVAGYQAYTEGLMTPEQQLEYLTQTWAGDNAGLNYNNNRGR